MVFDSFANDPDMMFLLGMAAPLLVIAPVLLWLNRRLAGLKGENARFRAESERARETLAAAPDGLFLWDRPLGEEKCSRRLAVMLGLAAGTQSRFSDVLSRFENTAAERLNVAVQDLHRNGTPFDLLLASDDRLFQATGGRAVTLDGRILNELMWVRDVTDTLTPQHQATAPAVDTASPLGSDAALDHFTFMLDSLPLAVWIRDANLRIVFANQAANRLGMVEGGADPATLKPTGQTLAERARADKVPACEQRLIDGKDGPMVLTQTEVPARGWSGTVGFAVERSPGRASARGAATLPLEGYIQQTVLDHLGTAIAIFDAKTRLVFSNTAFGQLWGLKQDWLDTSPALAEILDYLRARRRLPEVTDFRIFKDEQLGLFADLGGPEKSLLHLPDGRTLSRFVAPYSNGGLLFSFEDNTGRLDLERSFKALDAVQRETLDNLYEGIAVFGGDGRLKLSNPVFAGLWNLPPELLREGLHISAFIDATRPLVAGSDGPSGMSDEDWALHVDKIVARLSERRADTGRVRLNNGMILDYSNVALPDGAMLLSYLDVSDSARVEAALRQRAEALDQANRLKSEFIANVSHEVTTPLATLIGYADILAQQNYGDLNARQKEYSQGILENAQNLMGVINDILDLAAVEAGMMTLQLDTVELHTMLASLVHLIRERARRKNLKIKFDCPPDIGWIVADEKRLKQVLYNLLSNAINFTPPRGAITLTAERCGDVENETIVFKVSDTGRGIPKSRQMDIFEAFGHADRDDKNEDEEEIGRPGAGLGLTLVKRFVELHGGAVYVKSPPGRGTTVTCTLPAGGRKNPSQADVKAVDQQNIA